MVMQAVARAAKMGDAIQNSDKVSPQFFEQAKKLDSMKGRLVAGHIETKKLINMLQERKYKQRPIPFDNMENGLAKNFMNMAKRNIKKGNVELSAISSLFGPVSSFVSVIKPVLEGNIFNSGDDNDEVFTESESTVASLQPIKAKGENRDYMNVKFKIKNEGINTSKGDSIFNQISKKYLLWQTRE